MKMLNQVKMTFASRSVNESFSRAALAAFLAQADPTVPQLAKRPCQKLSPTASSMPIRIPSAPLR
mgnify:CR=1 FL=1